tara:strand:+ start:6893 stop:8320 length:1428 start_codon:yes stop_codon:yes gene_type:complete
MKPNTFRAHAHELVDWMADFLEQLEEHRVVPETKPGDIRAQLPSSAPQQGEPFSQIFADFQSTILPGMTLWNHPGWFAYFPANHSPPSILAEMLMATLGAQCMSWQTSPAATELEQVVMQWLRELLQLPETFVGTIQDTASSSTLVALLSARERVTSFQFGQKGPTGLDDKALCVYASKETHSSIDKAVKLAGIGLDHLRHVETDADFALCPEALEQAIREDLQRGHRPFCVVATVGTTSSSALDPLPAIGAICQKYDLWLHVDAAYAGTAAILPEKRALLDGIEYADSFVFNPHKWMFTNFDCSAYFVKDVDLLLRTFQTNPEYLKTEYDPQVVNFRDWGIPLGRRFRALKLWFVMRHYGVEGLQDLIRQHIRWAGELVTWIEADPDFECLAPAPLGLVCFRYHPAGCDDEVMLDRYNQTLLERINATGSCHLTHTRLGGKYTIRLCVGQLYTQREHVVKAWELCKQIVQEGLE